MSSSDLDPRQSAAQRSNQRVMLLIIGLPLTVVILATALWYFANSGAVDLTGLLGTKNRGELILPPRPIDRIPLWDVEGEALDYSEQLPQWTLLITGDGKCGASCRDTLYTTRQLHIALGKDANRVRRYYLNVDASFEPVFAGYLEKEHPKLRRLHTDGEALAQLTEELGVDDLTHEGHLLLVDPQGWIMMAYGADHSGKDIMKDLKVLLKAGSH